ncbi:uncharacterized protein LOC119355530 isoform X2 [Triticum dicoccoides]|uniref:uncharacterized protein LOC119355530 isoform X2 n=1 Tax=Triticum dicoccoides TaxID=85692 RepID=UPI00188FFFD4|nr:uncharacterized protein LOC119355530 isoform X2 [Triticum dicoccoides]XP_044457964.1 uncharacterized protein LOC123189578 isoform X2 [Triticum aestivum]
MPTPTCSLTRRRQPGSTFRSGKSRVRSQIAPWSARVGDSRGEPTSLKIRPASRRWAGPRLQIEQRCKRQPFALLFHVVHLSTSPDFSPSGQQARRSMDDYQGSTHAATGVVARISDGEFVLAAARGYDNIQNPLTAETLAFRDAITEAVKEGWQHVHFETACQIGSGEAKENASNLVPLKGDWYCLVVPSPYDA